MAYAAAISLKHNIEHFIDPAIIDPPITKSAWEILNHRIKDTLRILDPYNTLLHFDSGPTKLLDAELTTATWKLEDVLESYAFFRNNNGLPQIADKNSVEVEQEIDSFNQTAWSLGASFAYHRCQSDYEEDEDETDYGGNKSTTIELSGQLENIVDYELVDPQPGLKTVSIVGMAGIGKTHFAREIYQHPHIVRYFEFTAWVRVGVKGDEENILADIVAQIERKPIALYVSKNKYILRDLLKKSLCGRRYLIVLDDIWKAGLCRHLISCLPDDGVGRGRVLLTTRVRGVDEYKHSKIHEMQFMNNEESWELLWQNVFPDETSFPPQLEKAGKKIAENCEGLPLLILAIAQLLRGVDKTEEYWNKVANKKTTTFEDAYDRISTVLLKSYENLTRHLKACFLYMGVFPQSCEVPLSKFINLLIAEDILEPYQSDQTLEDSLIHCVNSLVAHSLVIIYKQSYNNTIKSSKLHSAYWYVCVKEARRTKFLHVLNKLTDCAQENIESQRRLSVQNNVLFGIKEAYDPMAGASTARSILCTGEYHKYQVPICWNLMLLRVVDALSIRFYEFPKEVVKLLVLRYLALTHNGELPSSISNLQRLQFLILRQHHYVKLLKKPSYLPKEIWDMQQLTHLWIIGSNLPDPNYFTKLLSLSTLHVNAHSCSQGVFRSIPNLKKLGIRIELEPAESTSSSSCVNHVRFLRELESLKCVVVNPRLRSEVVAPPRHLSNLPRGLRKVSLSGLGYPWKCMTAISWLPNLKVLKLRCYAFRGAEWETEVGEFQRLEFLLLEDIDLVEWKIYADSSGFRRRNWSDNCCFPRLQRLSIRSCFLLKEIPIEIGGISTLETVELADCNPAAVASALQLQQIRTSPLRLLINSSWNI